ncbi:hypothetical protein QJ857_gp0215 [Tupanvirus soda lake]|uniref:Uncharacterized protein n=2 Tax=Tupanvirus TaxID=2094720 RepID=A0A6N1NN71_9VIRU|nr:hypothetical protein QJ857_gp0215 [Tupanvirus soda lake]QKU35809.1 hypothetical protein [Tupanvirus soda lake]
MGNNVSFKREFGLIIVGGIVFTASFLWKDYLSDVRELYFPKKYGIFGRFVYTIIVTMILVMFAIHLRNLLGINSETNQDPKDTSIKFDDNPIRNSERVNIDFSSDSEQ